MFGATRRFRTSRRTDARGSYAAASMAYAANRLARMYSDAAGKKAPLMRRAKPKAKPKYKRIAKRVPAAATKNLAAKVRSLEKRVGGMDSQLIYKVDGSDTLRAGAGEALYGEQGAVSNTNIELALAQCRFFDPSTPGTLITGSLASPTYHQSVRVSVYARMVITNNYQVPCIVTCGKVMPKDDTNQSVNNSLLAGWADVGNPAQGSTLISYSDSPQFRQLWRVVGKLRSVRLEPGQSVQVKHGQKAFMYDPAFVDTETETYSRKYHSCQFVYRVQGVLSHDTAVSTQQGMSPAGIDVYVQATYVIHYNSGGTALKTIVLNELADQAFTNGAVVSQPVVDNQSYSVA